MFILNDDYTEIHRDMWVMKAEGTDQTSRDTEEEKEQDDWFSVLNMLGHCLFSSLQRVTLSPAGYIM